MLSALTALIFAALAPPVSYSGDPAASKAPEPKLLAVLDRDSAAVGSAVTLTLTYTLPEGATLAAEPAVGGLEGLSVVERRDLPGRIRIVMMIDRLGSWRTGPLSLAYSDGTGEPHALTAAPVSVTVLSNLGDKPEEAGLRPIQGIVRSANWWLKYWPWALVLPVLSALCAAVLWWRRRVRSNKRAEACEVPAHIWARKALEELEGQGLFESGAVKSFYFTLSEILRKYLEAIRGFPAAEYTTEEIAHSIRHREDQELVPLLKRIDLVKYADAADTRARKEEAVQAALAYIVRTAPPEADTGRRRGGALR